MKEVNVQMPNVRHDEINPKIDDFSVFFSIERGCKMMSRYSRQILDENFSKFASEASKIRTFFSSCKQTTEMKIIFIPL